MSKSLRTHRDWLSVLGKSKRKQRLSLITAASKPHIDILSECCQNTLKGHVPLSKVHKGKLSRFKHHLRKLACPSINWKTKKRFLRQTGGAFLPLLLGPIISGISGLIGNLFNRS